VWQSPDPILGSYLNGKPNGGVFNPSNLGLYSYVQDNPVLLTDPDGRASWRDRINSIRGAKEQVAMEGRYQANARAHPEYNLPSYTYHSPPKNALFNDCSDFVRQLTGVTQAPGAHITYSGRGTENQFLKTKPVPLDNILPGDLVFFKAEKGKHIVDHVGLVTSRILDGDGHVTGFFFAHQQGHHGRNIMKLDLRGNTSTNSRYPRYFVGVHSYNASTDPVRPNTSSSNTEPSLSGFVRYLFGAH